MDGLLDDRRSQPESDGGVEEHAADHAIPIRVGPQSVALMQGDPKPFEQFPITPPASAFFLSDLAIVSGWALLVSLLASDEFGWVWRLAPSSVLMVLLALILGATLLVFAAMVLRRAVPAWFALRADQHGVRWRDPYFVLFHRQALWVDVDRFHVADDYGPFGTVRMFRENASISLSNRPSAFDAPLPSNYGMSPRALAALLEQCRRAAPSPAPTGG